MSLTFLVANSHSSNSCSSSVSQLVGLSVTRCDIYSPLRECLILLSTFCLILQPTLLAQISSLHSHQILLY